MKNEIHYRDAWLWEDGDITHGMSNNNKKDTEKYVEKLKEEIKTGKLTTPLLEQGDGEVIGVYMEVSYDLGENWEDYE